MLTGIGKKLVKYSLVVCNLLLCVTGLAIFVLALLIRYQTGVQGYAAQKLGEHLDQLTTDMIVFAVIGFTMFVVGFAAFVGAGCENLLALRIYVVSVILIAMAQFGYAIALICIKENIKKRMYEDMTVFVINYDLQSDEMRLHFDSIQHNGKCCGCYGRQDYRKLRYPVPGSCSDDGQEGCCPMMWRNMKKLAGIFGCIASAIGFLEYVAVIFACILISSIQKCRYDVKKSSKAGSKFDSVELRSYRRAEKSQ